MTVPPSPVRRVRKLSPVTSLDMAVTRLNAARARVAKVQAQIDELQAELAQRLERVRSAEVTVWRWEQDEHDKTYEEIEADDLFNIRFPAGSRIPG